MAVEQRQHDVQQVQLDRLVGSQARPVSPLSVLKVWWQWAASPRSKNRTIPGSSSTIKTLTVGFESIASPLVAGTAALYKARHPDATPARVIERIHTQAKVEPASHGFDGDSHSRVRNRYCGYLAYAGDF